MLIAFLQPRKSAESKNKLPSQQVGGQCRKGVPSEKKVTVSALGHLGAFGNQIHQYIFAKIYADRTGVQLETPDWIGDYLYGLSDPKMTVPFCFVVTDKQVAGTPKSASKYVLKSKFNAVNVDLWGFFQFSTQAYTADRDYIRSLFVPTQEVEDIVQPAVDSLRARGKTLVSIHLRRGDFGKPPFLVAPEKWYLDWLASIWNDLADPVLFIASDELDLVVPKFNDYHPVTIRDLNVQLPAATFYPEHYILSQSDYLAISNSTFSFTTSMLNRVGKEFVRPHFQLEKLVRFDPWNSIPFEQHW